MEAYKGCLVVKVPVPKLDNLNLISSTHIVEGED